MRGGTLFSGIGAPECAMPWIDWRWAAEIDPFASAVHAIQFPNVLNLGDVTRIDSDAIESVDLVVFGSPCQSFSIAGKRLGLDDPRGNLALVALRLIGKLRPRWMVFENVPGLLSSDGGRDFGAILGLLGQCGYGFAYRIFDAQFAGVPQRRRRVFVVGYHGDWRPPASVLFEPKSLRGDTAPCREAGQRVARCIEAGANRTGGPRPYGTTVDTAESLIARCVATGSNGQRYDWETETFVTHTLSAAGSNASEDGTGRGTPLVPVAFQSSQFDLSDAASLRAASGGSSRSYIAGMAVRRLTPTECEKLQGLPTGWTAIEYRGKTAADGPRYRAIGNSMAVPVVAWIGHRIRLFEEVTAQSSAKDCAA